MGDPTEIESLRVKHTDYASLLKDGKIHSFWLLPWQSPYEGERSDLALFATPHEP